MTTSDVRLPYYCNTLQRVYKEARIYSPNRNVTTFSADPNTPQAAFDAFERTLPNAWVVEKKLNRGCYHDDWGSYGDWSTLLVTVRHDSSVKDDESSLDGHAAHGTRIVDDSDGT